MGRIVIQTFDEALRPCSGLPHALCIHRETAETWRFSSTGILFRLDHYVESGISSATSRDCFDRLDARSTMQSSFGQAKRDTLPSGAARAMCFLPAMADARRTDSSRVPMGSRGSTICVPLIGSSSNTVVPVVIRLATHMRAWPKSSLVRRATPHLSTRRSDLG